MKVKKFNHHDEFIFNNDLILSSVIPPEDHINGLSQEELSANWWQYVYSIPSEDNPFFYDIKSDPQGDKAQINQEPPVFYFVGTFDESGEVTRQVEIAPNEGYQYLFMPLVNNQWDEVQLEGLTNQQIQGVAQAIADTALVEGGSLFASIDGVPIKDLEDYRQASGRFTYDLPDNNILGFPSQTVENAFADGFYLGIDLTALSPENHTINFGGVFNFEELDIPDNLGLEDLEELFQTIGKLSQNITYNISFDLNEINGTNRRDFLIGTDGWDEIKGFNGNDRIVGLEGNDALYGGRGSDTLIGVNPYACNPGYGEIDILDGGNGRDTFVLGDFRQAYYKGKGLQDYALIKDFSTQDTIQLHGNRCLYELSETYSLGGKSGTSIFLKDTYELIGFVEGVTGLSLASNDFSFVCY
jgi:hypothetical protein